MFLRLRRLILLVGTPHVPGHHPHAEAHAERADERGKDEKKVLHLCLLGDRSFYYWL
jgi:hypothetical protein